MNSKCHHFVVDAFPHMEGQSFTEYAGAAIGCWVPVSADPPEALIERNLLVEGWEVASVIEHAVVDSERYRTDDNGRSEFEQALLLGFAAHIHGREREVLLVNEVGHAAETLMADYPKAVRQLSRGGYSFYSSAEGAWANGVTPDGDDFLPIWTDARDASAWAMHWPSYAVTAISVSEFLGSDGVLAGIASEDMWAAFGIGDALVTVHAQCLARDLDVVTQSP